MLSPAAAMRLLRAHAHKPKKVVRRVLRRRLALDVSNVNPATLQQVKASGCAVLLCKATQSNTFEDKTLAEHRQIAKQLRIPFGSYLFLDPDVDGAVQARYYLAWARPRRGDVQPIIDAENVPQKQGRAPSPATIDACANELARHGFQPILYCSSSFWLRLVAARPGLRRLHIWEAQYPGAFTRWLPRLAKLRAKLRHGASVVMWQWTDRATVGGRGFDESLILAPAAKLLIGGRP